MNTKTKFSLLILMGFLTITSCGKKETAPVEEQTETSTEGEQAPTAAPAEENVLVIEGNDQMQFNTNELKAVAGKPIKLTLKHVGKIPKEAMGHNLVILQEGTDEADFALKKSFDLVTEQNKRLLNFSYIVSHNLRSHASNILGISTLIQSNLKLTIFQSKQLRFILILYITLFDWLKQLRSLSIDTPFRAIPTKQPASAPPPQSPSRLYSPTRQDCCVEKHPHAAHPKQHQFDASIHPTTKKQATQKPIQGTVDCYIITRLRQENVPLQTDPRRPQEPRRGTRQWSLSASNPLRSREAR
mgnify:CR=1 FL=1